MRDAFSFTVCACITQSHSLSISLLDDDNRIALQALPSEVAEEAEDSDYVNAYMGDYINASYIDVSLVPRACLC